MKSQIYLISPPIINDLVLFQKQIEEIAATNMVAAFQLRLKNIENRDIIKIGKQIAPIIQNANIAFIINDNVNIARDLGADGVHLGQEDGTIADARKILGKDVIIGRTCHNSRHLAMNAADEGADYVAFGAFYSTETKEVKYIAEVEILNWWQDLMEIPCVAIGGINTQNALPIINAGADFIAVSSGVWNYEGGAIAALAEFQNLINGN